MPKASHMLVSVDREGIVLRENILARVDWDKPDSKDNLYTVQPLSKHNCSILFKTSIITPLCNEFITHL